MLPRCICTLASTTGAKLRSRMTSKWTSVAMQRERTPNFVDCLCSTRASVRSSRTSSSRRPRRPSSRRSPASQVSPPESLTCGCLQQARGCERSSSAFATFMRRCPSPFAMRALTAETKRSGCRQASVVRQDPPPAMSPRRASKVWPLPIQVKLASNCSTTLRLTLARTAWSMASTNLSQSVFGTCKSLHHGSSGGRAMMSLWW
mmetsp:Transcript_112751/g.299544  ORF Transcript_112751/g.299544 Transcript_112751/m.299544 type:complete len:204 (-) Transcript_112751:1052-1663(-)